MKIQILLNCVFLGLVFGIIFSACQKDEDKDLADYNGSWETYHDIPLVSGYSSVRFEIKLENSNYSEIFIESNVEANYYRYVVWSGEVIKTDNKLQFKVTSIKEYDYDPVTEEVLDLVYETVPGTAHVNRSLTLSWETVLYSINNGNLEIRVDWNEDGDYEDEDEFLIYTPVN